CHGQHLILEMPLTIYTFWWSGCRDRIRFNEDKNSGRKFYCIESNNIGSSEISGACPKGMLSNIVKEVIFTSLTGCYAPASRSLSPCKTPRLSSRPRCTDHFCV